MMPVIPCSTNNVTLFHGSTTFISRKNYQLKRSSSLQKCTRQASSTQYLPLPLSTSTRLLPKYRSACLVRHGSRVHILAAAGTDVAVEEPGLATAGEDTDGNLAPTSAAETGDTSSTEETTTSAQSKRPRAVRKSDMPTVSNEELVPGATFTGKVRSIQPFGAFVDFGAFTDGLVHVSQLSDNFVKVVGDVVSLGQEVKVRLVEVNMETKRISLTMRSDDGSKSQQRKDSSGSSNDKSRPGRRATKASKFVKGQDLDGTVKNLNRAGAYISLPEEEEGFLPVAEETNEGYASMTDGSSLQIGQEVKVRVLRITRGQVTLTMKKEEDIAESNSQTIQGVVYTATNPFARAFRGNKDIAAFLDESDKVQKTAQTSLDTKVSEEIEGTLSQTENLPEISEVQESSEEGQVSVPSAADDVVKDHASTLESAKEVEALGTSLNDTAITDEASLEETEKEAEVSVAAVNPATTEPVTSSENPEDLASDSSKGVNEVQETTQKEVASESLRTEESAPSTISETDGLKDDVTETNPDIQVDDQSLSTETAASEEAQESQADDIVVKAEGQENAPSAIENEIPSPTPDADVNQILSTETAASEEAQDSQADDTVVKAEKQENAPSAIENEIPPPTPNADVKLESISEKNDSLPASNAEGGSSSSQVSPTTVTIPPSLVKHLREETGAGMMDCKKALAETGGDLVKAQEFLRKKGLASADKRAAKVTAEGRIGSYIHDSRIGVLIEVNCETDFVSRGDIFKELVNDLAMQVAACPQVKYLVTEDVSQDIVDKEREIEMQKEDLLSKPEQIRSKIVDGRIKKRLEELALLEQPYIKNDKMVVKDWVKQTIATVGENIKVKRFVRYNLGEGLEKRSQDFAAEVAAQTSAKASPVAQPVAVETKEADTSSSKVTISAALVKQLREETGAGMMDCKKALTETSGDLEKAQEYLRKKGLTSADKKSSRIAAEGRIGSYIHDARVGVLIEVNCETDFVGRSQKFKELVDDLAMQVAACPLVQFVSIEDIPESIVSKEKELEMQREDLQSKPVNIREKIVEGRISKRLGTLALLEQPFIKDDSLLVKDLVKQTVAAIGENIKVRRFSRFTLGEVKEDAKESSEA